MPNCEEYELLISARLDGALSPEESARLEAHLAGCPQCRRLAAELGGLKTLWDELPLVQPPADLNSRIMEAVRRDNVVPLIPSEYRKKPLQWKRWAASAAVLDVILIGAGGLRLSHSGSAPQSAGLASVQENAAAPANANPENGITGFGAAAPEARDAAPDSDAAKAEGQPSTGLTLSLPPQVQALSLCADQAFPGWQTDESAATDAGQETFSLPLVLPDGSRWTLSCGEADASGQYPVTCQSGETSAHYLVDLAAGTVTPESP